MFCDVAFGSLNGALWHFNRSEYGNNLLIAKAVSNLREAAQHIYQNDRGYEFGNEFTLVNALDWGFKVSFCFTHFLNAFICCEN